MDLVVQDKVHEVDQKVHEALDEKEHQDPQIKQILAVKESWSHLFLRSRVKEVGVDVPNHPSEYNHRPRTKVKCGVGSRIGELGYRTGFSEEHPSRFTTGCKYVKNRHRRCPEITCNIGNAHLAKKDVKRLPFSARNPLQVPMDSRERSIVSLSSKIRILLIACWTSAIRFQNRLLNTGPARVANAKFLKPQPFCKHYTSKLCTATICGSVRTQLVPIRCQLGIDLTSSKHCQLCDSSKIKRMQLISKDGKAIPHLGGTGKNLGGFFLGASPRRRTQH